MRFSGFVLTGFRKSKPRASIARPRWFAGRRARLARSVAATWSGSPPTGWGREGSLLPLAGMPAAFASGRGAPPGRMRASAIRAGRLAPAPLHLAAAEQQPVHRHVLLHGERDQEVGVGSGAALISIHVLLKHAEVARELTLRSLSANFRDPIRQLALDAIH